MHYRPTCHYTYHPCGTPHVHARSWRRRQGWRRKVLNENRLVDVDELGVLLYPATARTPQFAARILAGRRASWRPIRTPRRAGHRRFRRHGPGSLRGRHRRAERTKRCLSSRNIWGRSRATTPTDAPTTHPTCSRSANRSVRGNSITSSSDGGLLGTILPCNARKSGLGSGLRRGFSYDYCAQSSFDEWRVPLRRCLLPGDHIAAPINRRWRSPKASKLLDRRRARPGLRQRHLRPSPDTRPEAFADSTTP